MPNFGASDVPALFADMGVNVVFGAFTTKGTKDEADQEALERAGLGGLVMRGVTVTVQRGTLPGLTIGSAVTVDGEPLKVAAALSIEDGELEQLICATT